MKSLKRNRDRLKCKSMYFIDDNEASLIIDDFTGERSIQLTKIAGSKSLLIVETFELTYRMIINIPYQYFPPIQFPSSCFSK